MKRFNIENTNEYKSLLNNRTLTGFIGNKISRKSIDDYFNWVKEKYHPTTATSLDNLLKQKEQELNEAISLQQVSLIKDLMFDILEELGKEIRSQSQQRLNQLFTQPRPLDFQTVDKKEVDSLKIDDRVLYDTSDVIFLTNCLIEEVFFSLIPRELEKELKQEPEIKLSELPAAEWNTKRDELLSDICAQAMGRGLPELESVEKAINEKYQDLVAIVQKARTSKPENSKPVCNDPQHQQLQNQRDTLQSQNQTLKNEKADLEQLRKTVHDSLHRVYRRWIEAAIIERGKEDEVLGKNWAEVLQEKETISEVNSEETRLIKNIGDEENKEKANQITYENQIQTEIDKANNFINNSLYLTAEASRSLLKKLRDFRSEWGEDKRNPAKQHAFSNKNKGNALGELIIKLQVKIRAEEAISVITEALNKEPKLGASEIGTDYVNFETRLRRMKEEEINKYENQAIDLISSMRPIHAKIKELIDSGIKISNTNDNSQETQKKREEVLDLIFDLEKFSNSTRENQATWLVYIQRQEAVDNLVYPRNGSLFGIARGQALSRLNKKKEWLESHKIHINKTEFANYQQKINQANFRELQSQKYENEFLQKVLEKQQTSQIQQPPK